MEFNWLSLTYLLAVLALVAPGAWYLNRGRGTVLTSVAVWLGLAVLAALLYRVITPA